LSVEGVGILGKLGVRVPVIYLRQDLFDEILKRKEETTSFVNKTVEEALWKKQPAKKPEEKPKPPRKKK